ncbi:MAG: gliding motility-associated C-terminal domain-containing protein [Bacteroidia bacterium]
MKKYFFVLSFIALFFSNRSEAVANTASPDVRCISVAANGDVTLTWIIPVNTGTFTGYHIFTSNTFAGPYTDVLTVAIAAQTSAIITPTNANNAPVYFYVETNNTGNVFSAPIDTLASIKLNVTNPGNGTALLNWNPIHTPNLPTSTGIYDVYREYPTGTWTLVGSTKNLIFADTITVCKAFLNYKVQLADASGCISVSSIAGALFKDLIVPHIPLLDTVSINPAGKATISWYPSYSTNVEGYIVYQNIGGIWTNIANVVGRLTTFYTNPASLAATKSEQYRVAAYDSCNNISPMGNIHNSLFLKNNYNVCAVSNTLSWNPYINMISGINTYNIYVSINGAGFTLLATTTDTLYEHANLQSATTYCYIVKALDNSNTRTSLSQTLCTYTHFPKEPNFAYARTATVTSPSSNLILARTDTSAEISNYEIERADNASGPFQILGTVPSSANPNISYTDNTALPNQQSYFYQIVPVDSCGKEAPPSNSAQTIFLQASADNNFNNTLSWNPYTQWNSAVSGYKIYRGIDGVISSTPINFVPASSGQNTYIDNVSNELQGTGVFSYYVEAFASLDDGFNFIDSSASNIAEALQNPKFFVPNAFTPGIHGNANTIFKPISVYIDPADYNFTIYDRYGRQFFNTSNPQQGWDGSIGGQDAPVGVYVYFIKYKASNGQYTEQKGTVALIR